ncbi:glycoside hydrolase family 3 protein [Paenibacillus methanolicus]|uniref:Beta-glucosidase n=1 Tax=Paenibacillus methanolicus TaxID=582686 RepID=A0A5S5CLM2_9BACL|nr:glycoside hydrolase family 3 protein [Paenibacillus methanolicus]TYP79595.1 beta-glucosidase [Paenibacillus methanolicus]
MANTTQYPFQDASLPLEARVEDLVSRLTLDEKVRLMPQYMAAIDRLGIGPYKHGTEAAHGIAWLGEATSYPQPIGLACTWDTELLKRIGSAIGDEARVFYKRNPAINGLTLWAPTVDMERDPRWGRTEEAYGEDPHLTGELSAALVQGIQGDHPFYFKAVATLKHFLGNNNEINRGSCSVSIDPRNMHEYYLKAFEPAFVKGGAQSMMTAYNSVNGTPALLLEDVNRIVKEKWGMDGFVVSDAGDMMGIVNDHHYYETYAHAVADTIKSGVDSITDEFEPVCAAIREALAQGLLEESDLDRALRNTFRVRIRLGEFNPEDNPYEAIGESVLLSSEHAALSREAARKSVVLLKNEGGLLPLNAGKLNSAAVIGPLANIVYRDWYSGTFPYKVTPLEAIGRKLEGKTVAFEDGSDLVRFACADGRALTVENNDALGVKAVLGEGEIFHATDWGWGAHTFISRTTGKYVTTANDATLTAGADDIWGWFVKEIVNVHPQASGEVKLTSWNKRALELRGDELALSDRPGADHAAPLRVIQVKDGLADAVRAAKEAEVAVVVVGNHPLINGKEEIDRPDLTLAESQERLVREVYAANPNTVVVVVGSYPFALNWVQENVPAIVYVSHAGQELGNAIADILFGDAAPGGRLNMTWYKSSEQLSDFMEYDIRKGKKTYQYFDGEALYPFGHGLTYATFNYGNLRLSADRLQADQTVTISVDVTNASEVQAEEVVQLYGRAIQSRVERPIKSLLGFARIALAAGETQTVQFELNAEALAFWDVTRDQYCVENGAYEIQVGRSSADIAVAATLEVEGETVPARDLSDWTRSENYDEYDRLYLDESKEGGTCVVPAANGAWLLFRDAELGAGAARFEARVASIKGGGRIEIRLGDAGGTLVGETEVSARGSQEWHTVACELTGASGRQDICLVLSGNVRISRIRLQ